MHTRVMLHALEPLSLCLSHTTTPGHRDANLVCRTGLRHRTRSHVSLISSPPQGCRLSVSLAGSEYSSHVRVLLPDTPTVHLPTSRPLRPVGSAYSTARRTHRLDANGSQTNNLILMLASLPFTLPDPAGLKELYHLSTYCKLP